MAGLLSGRSRAQAVLFYGEEGTGAEHAASELAKAWLCRQGGESGPCGECPVCRSYDSGRAVDFQAYEPSGPSAWIKMTAIRRDPKAKLEPDEPEVMPLAEFFRTGPLMAGHKVALFRSVERMNAQTANALLKTLEEPPVFGRLVLTTSEPSRLLPTVRSRCLNVACERPLTEEWSAPDRLSALFGPTPGSTLAVQGHREAYEGLLQVLDAVPRAPRGAALALADRFRTAADGLADARKLRSRAAHAEALRCAAEWARRERPESAAAAVEAHRLVTGNVNAGPVTDWLFTVLLR
jgi:hypothetical protein